MAKTKQVAARCWYCDAPGVTHDHVLARSLSKLFPGHGVFRLNYEHPELGVRHPPKRAPTFMIKARRVLPTLQ